ncbi:MAG TPA: alanine racemase [Candidatus Kapabacteria bacterium]|nr:alanine racemase [Candidatus Kapabacteria bacterium]
MIRPTRALIDTDALRNNVSILRSRIPATTRIMGIAKADCYGHGAAICIPVLQECGIDTFGVATIQEAIGLRELGVTGTVAVLPPPLEGEYHLFPEHDIETVLSTPEMASRMAAAADAAGRRVRVHLFVDTGMGRNGARPADALSVLGFCSSFDSLEIVGIASHFATSDEPQNSFTMEQIGIFDHTVRMALDAGFRFRDIHIANSGGLLNFSASHYTLVRPGLALYGYHPTPELQSASGLAPVMSLRSVIGNVTRMPAGTSVSYGRRYFTPCDTLVATVPIGYADGVMRILTNNLTAIVRGRRVPVVGTICMDEVMLDLGPVDGSQPGDEVILIGSSDGEEINAWDIAARAGTIPYEICTGISRRVPRIEAPPIPDDVQNGERT